MAWVSRLPSVSGSPDDERHAWWDVPAPLTAGEIGGQRYLADMTRKLSPADQMHFWDVGGSQKGVFSIRYQAAFCGYAAAALGMRTPAYPAVTGAILQGAIDLLLDKRAWSYVRFYWRDQPWYPDPVAHENIMYSGHLLQLLVLYEMLTGDTQYRDDGFTLRWDDKTAFDYDTLSLARTIAGQMRASPSGGVACEPGLIFFPCNNHPQIALLMLERRGMGDWSDLRAKWEKFALGRFRAFWGGGAIKLAYYAPVRMFIPRGHPGLDGWSLLWYHPWAANPATTARIWDLASARIPWSELRDDAAAERWPDAGADCCRLLKVPAPAVISFLYPAALAAGDKDAAVRLRRLLDVRRTSDDYLFLELDPEYRIGSTANYLLGLSLENGACLRAMVRNPLPADYFEGPWLRAVNPDATPVYQAFRPSLDKLVLEFEGPAGTVLELANVSRILYLKGLHDGQWSFDGRLLRVEPAGRHSLELSVAVAADSRNKAAGGHP